jgi:uncharacterized membrane protein (DUF485 family)
VIGPFVASVTGRSSVHDVRSTTVGRHQGREDTARPTEVTVSSSLDDNAGGPRVPADEDDYNRIQASPQFQELRRRHRSIVFPLTALFLAWYFLYVLLADYAHDFMAQKVWGNITVGLLLGLGQFASTFIITMVYARWANNRQDAVAERLRLHIEEGTLDGGVV